MLCFNCYHGIWVECTSCTQQPLLQQLVMLMFTLQMVEGEPSFPPLIKGVQLQGMLGNKELRADA